MGVIASIESTTVAAEPGTRVASTIRVRNTGMVVDQVLLDVLGDAQPWVSVQPAQLNLLPGSDAEAQLVFAPPRSSAVLAGTVPFAIRAMSQEDPAGSAIEEGCVEVGSFAEITAALMPGRARGRRRAKFQLVIENQGNTPVQSVVSVTDPDLLLEFKVQPRLLVAQPGTATFVRLLVAPKKRFLRGQDRNLPFQATVQADGCGPAAASGTLVQEQVMPRWLLPAIAITIAAAAALTALWFAVLKPQVHSIATQAVAAASRNLASSAAKANQAAQRADQAAQRANSAGGGTGGGSGSGSGSGAGTGTGGGSGSTGGAKKPGTAGAAAKVTPVSTMLQANAKPSATFATASYGIGAKQTLDVTDIVLENPVGDTGLLQIRSGTKVLFTFGLANFRSIDYHFVQPLVFTKTGPLVLAVRCQNPGGKACADGLSFSGTLHG